MNDLHKNHRKRMYKKAETAGLSNMPEHEVLEMLLYAVIPRGNTNEIAIKMCRRFGSISGVLKADVNELMEIDGVGNKTAQFIHSLPEVLGIVERSLNFPDKRISNREEALEYVKTFFFGKATEQFYMISLTSKGGIIKHNKLGDGITDEVHVYARNVAQTAMQNHAHSVIIAHNHPGGTLNPSYSDVKCTEEIAAALKTLNIELYDSIVVARGEANSIFDSELCSIKR